MDVPQYGQNITILHYCQKEARDEVSIFNVVHIARLQHGNDP